MEHIPGPGATVKHLRKRAGLSQPTLARRAAVSLSLIGKIEIGERALTAHVAAAIAHALGVSLTAIYRPADPTGGTADLEALRAAVRRYDLPDLDLPVDPPELQRDVSLMISQRARADVGALMATVPELLHRATSHAHRTHTTAAWGALADVYSAVYWLAARHRWVDLLDIAPERQAWAATQRTDPVAAGVATRDRAGTYLNTGDFAGGLAIVDRGVAAAERSTLDRPQRAYVLGILHLRGLTLAGRIHDRAAVERHRRGAIDAADHFATGDVYWHGLHFGRRNLAVHLIATDVDLTRHRRALRAAEDLRHNTADLAPTRRGPLQLNIARARLALGDTDGALHDLADAWDTAPQIMRVHPTALETLRVLRSRHLRSNPVLTRLCASVEPAV